MQINYNQSGNTITVATNSSGTFNFFNATSVDFTITVPNTTDLQIHTNAGSINIRTYILDRPNSIELSPCDFQPLRFLPRFASLSLLTGGVCATILTISVKPLSSFDGFAFWSFPDLL